MSPLEKVRQFIASRPTPAPVPDDLRLQVLAILARDGRQTAKSLALALGRPRDEALYNVLGELLEAYQIATDPAKCDFYTTEDSIS